MEDLGDTIKKIFMDEPMRFGDTISTSNNNINATTLEENLNHFKTSNGSISILSKKIQNYFPSTSSEEINHFIETPISLTDRDYFLLCIAMKQSIVDWNYHFETNDNINFSEDHKIYELGPIDERVIINRQKEQDKKGINGKTFRTAIKVFNEITKSRLEKKISSYNRNNSSQLIKQKIKKKEENLIKLTNCFIKNEQYHINLETLTDSNNWYTVRFANNFYEFLKIMSNEATILEKIGEQNLPNIIKVSTTTINIEDGCLSIPKKFQKYNELAKTETILTGQNYALVKLTFTDDAQKEMGQYINQFKLNSSTISSKTMESIPNRIYDLRPRETIVLHNGNNITETNLKVPAKILSKVQEILNYEKEKENFFLYLYQWNLKTTGWTRFFDPTNFGRNPVIPVKNDFKEDFKGSIGRIGKLALSILIPPLGLYASYINQKNQIRIIRDLENELEESSKNSEKISSQKVQRKINDTIIAQSALFQLSAAKKRYEHAWESGNAADTKFAKETMSSILKEIITSDINSSSILATIRKEGLFLVYENSFNTESLAGRSGAKVFSTSLFTPDTKTNIAKRYKLREMGFSEYRVYQNLSNRTPENWLEFPTPEILAYNEIPDLDRETKKQITVPMLLMETIEGPTVEKFFKILNTQKNLENSKSIKQLKYDIVEDLVCKFSKKLSESTSSDINSLGSLITKLREDQPPPEINYSVKMQDVLNDCILPSDSPLEDFRNLENVAKIISHELQPVERLPFFDMAHFNHSISIKDLYSQLLVYCNNENDIEAEQKAAAQPIEETTQLSIDTIKQYSQIDNADSQISGLVSNSIRFYDWDKLVRLNTLEFDDLTHIVDSHSFNPSQKERELLHAEYIAERYLTIQSDKDIAIGQIKDGHANAASNFMRDIINYDELESQRSLVSIYRNLRWINFYNTANESKVASEDILKGKNFHKQLVITECNNYISINSNNLDKEKINNALKTLKTYTLEVIEK